MFRVLALALVVIWSGATPTAASNSIPKLERGTAVVILGEVTSLPKAILGELKLQVAVGPAKTDYTLHFNGATLTDANGLRLDENSFDDGQWVRAEGYIMKDPRRIRVTRLQVVARDGATLQHSAFFPAGLEHGFIMSVAGTRQTYPDLPPSATRPVPMVVVGRVSGGTHLRSASQGLRLAVAGNEWALHVPDSAQVLDLKGDDLTLQSIEEKQWVRAHGWRTDDLRMHVARIEKIGKEDALKSSGLYRAGSPLGYTETVPVSTLQQRTLIGKITDVNVAAGSLTLMTTDNRSHVLWLPGAEIIIRNRTTADMDARVGDEVVITTFTFK